MRLRQIILKTFIALSLLGAASAAAAQLATAPASPPAAETTVADANYAVGLGDIVEVQLLERNDFNAKARVDSDGMIQLPYIGSLRALGKTAQVLRTDIRKALIDGGYFANPNLSVQIVSFASRYVTVLGSVASPGMVVLDRPYRLSEVIARVGGVRETGADYVVVRPATGEPRRYSVTALAVGDQAADPYVAPGDTVFSPNAEIFYISGQVRSPGSYALTTGMTLRMAISRGGGLTDMGSDRRVKITRAGKPAKVGLDELLQPGDVVSVGERLF